MLPFTLVNLILAIPHNVFRYAGTKNVVADHYFKGGDYGCKYRHTTPAGG